MFAPGFNTLTVTFDQPLTAGGLDPGNWTFRVDDRAYVVVIASASGNEVELSANIDSGDPGPNVVSYSPPPFDVMSDQGVPANAISDFPITT